MRRRAFLAAGAGAASGLLAGCAALLGQEPREPPVVEDRPDAVYFPTHVEGMEMAAMTESEQYGLSLSYSFPHRFWNTVGRDTERVSVGDEIDDGAVHLMINVWDAETGVVVPVGEPTVEIARDGEHVLQRSLWPMLSQRMGYHFGDNLSLDGDGSYVATIEIPPLDAARTGAFADRFDERVAVDVEFEYSAETRNDLAFTEFEDRQGDPGAVEPMGMDVPLASTPSADELPGTTLGEAKSGDATFLAAAVEDAARFGAEGRAYLVVSPRTPYNEFPIPFMGLSARLERDGDAAFADELTPTLDPDLGYHYGAVVESVEGGDRLAVSVDLPPQVSRHEGYETAFLAMGDVEFEV